jgi:hypothetical protein
VQACPTEEMMNASASSLIQIGLKYESIFRQYLASTFLNDDAHDNKASLEVQCHTRFLGSPIEPGL